MEIKKGIEILIVEDSATQAERLAYLLEQQGYIVTTAANGRAALEAIDKRRPAVIVSDIVMPEMDGFQLCRLAKNDLRFKDIPLILLTALSEPEDVLKGLECGADTFLTKPYDDDYLLEHIHHVVVNAELRKETNGQGLEVFYKGRKYSISSERQQILGLLLSTYETAIKKNRELKDLQKKLEALNERLEKRVEERTWALVVEIEERKKAEAEISRLNEELEKKVIQRTAQLEEANRDMESFSYSVAHDLKAPLRAIEGFSFRLLKKYGGALDDEYGRLVGVIRENVQKMGRLIDDILIFSRAGRQELEPDQLDMNNVLRDVVQEIIAGETGREIRLEIKELPSAMGDKAAVRQVFSNLLTNAVKFAKPREVAMIEVGGQEGKDEVVYYVKDNGVGFDEQYSLKLFGVFQRLHGEGEFEGTGIGLAIVKRFINKLGGRVWAEGRVNEGATFYFTLPGCLGTGTNDLVS